MFSSLTATQFAHVAVQSRISHVAAPAVVGHLLLRGAVECADVGRDDDLRHHVRERAELRRQRRAEDDLGGRIGDADGRQRGRAGNDRVDGGLRTNRVNASMFGYYQI